MPTVTIPYFDNAEAELESDGDDLFAPPPSPEQIAETQAAFLALILADRAADGRHVHAYYRDFREAIGEPDWLDDEMGVVGDPDGIWRHVRPRTVSFAMGPDGDSHCYVMVSADCDWEPEHGLLMVWRDGRTLTKVGGDDGHVTNAYAYSDPGLRDVVYHGIDRQFRTFLTK